MPLFVDVKYANMLIPRLPLGKRVADYTWNYRCPVCGDSSKNQRKARGYIYRVKTGLFAKCHNCGYSTNLGNLIKHVDSNLYKEYVLENYKEGGAPHTPHKDPNIAIPRIIRPPTEMIDSVLDTIYRIDQLPHAHPAVQYVNSRLIPANQHKLLYFAPKFFKFVNGIEPNKFDLEKVVDHPRLIIPYLDKHGRCVAFQGRAFGLEDPKYITIKVDPDSERIFGIDRLNYADRVYVVEGPIDSLFLPNSIAVSGSSFNTPFIEALKTNATVVYDNEPRSPELLKLIGNSIARGFSVCLWPDTVEHKDINDMVKAGMTPAEIIDIIDANTYNGAVAQMRFSTWRKR